MLPFSWCTCDVCKIRRTLTWHSRDAGRHATSLLVLLCTHASADTLAQVYLRGRIEEMVHGGRGVSANVADDGDIHVEKVLVRQVLQVHQEQTDPQVPAADTPDCCKKVKSSANHRGTCQSYALVTPF